MNKLKVLPQGRYDDIRENGIRRLPETVHLFINSRCNYRCLFCHFYAEYCGSSSNGKSELGLGDIRRVVKEIASMGVKHIGLSANGEPTLHPQIGEIIEFIKKAGLSLTICTNATFKKSLASKIALCDEIIVNLAAPDEKLYGQIHRPVGAAGFDTVLANIEALKELRKKLVLNVVVTDYNYDHMDGLFAFACSHGFDRIDFVVSVPDPKKSNLLLSKENAEKLLRALAKTGRFKKYPIEHDLRYLKSFLRDFGRSPFRFKGCYAGWFNFFIFPDGKTSFCRGVPFAGDIHQASLKEIWFSRKAHLLRLNLRHNLSRFRTFFCDRCRFAEMNQALDKRSSNKESL